MIKKLTDSYGLVSEIVHFVKSWLRVDQIRIRPREGEIWRLEPGAVVVVNGRSARIVSRAVGDDAEGPYVAYQCETSAGIAELIAQPTGEWIDFDRAAWNSPRITWREWNQRRVIDPAAFEVVCRCSSEGRGIR
jgi:hypothetical protein